jgi:hypothetical protein
MALPRKSAGSNIGKAKKNSKARKMSDDDDISDEEVAHAVEFMLSNQRAQQMKSYLDRGRGLEHASSEQLQRAYEIEMERWAESVEKYAQTGARANEPTRLFDSEAEFSIRGEEPPFESVRIIPGQSTGIWRGLAKRRPATTKASRRNWPRTIVFANSQTKRPHPPSLTLKYRSYFHTRS